MAAVAEVLSRAFPATTTLQLDTNIDVLLSADNKMERLGASVKEHLILGISGMPKSKETSGCQKIHLSR
jgi:hypothetical protein